MNHTRPQFLCLHLLTFIFFVGANGFAFAQQATQETATNQKASSKNWWSETVTAALDKAADNKTQLVKALNQIDVKQRPAMVFLIENMPLRDLKELTAEFLLENVRLAYQARAQAPWGDSISDEMFFNDVVAYANANEKREPWRAELYKKCWPIVKDCTTAAEAASTLR